MIDVDRLTRLRVSKSNLGNGLQGSLRDAFREVNMLRGLLRERKELADARRQALEYLEA